MAEWEPQQYDPRQHQQRLRSGQPPQLDAPWERYGPGQGQWQPEPPPYNANPAPIGHRRQQQQRRGGRYAGWAGLAAVIVLAMAGGAFYVVHSRASAGPLTCAQQYTNWKNGPANADGKQLEAAAASLSADGKTEDIPAMDADLKTLGTDAAKLEGYPMPACADPAGYWEQYLGQMKAAGDNAGTATGLGGLILAEAPLKQVPAIQSKLTAELAKTAGVKAS